MKNIFLLSGILFLLGLTTACNNSETETTETVVNTETTTTPEAAAAQGRPATTMAFADTLQDFGTKTQGEMLNFAYEFTNTGDQPLFIEEVIPSCGCSVADYPKQAIAPGGKGEIKVEFDTNKGGLGSVQKLITVVANDANKPQHYLLFQGTVEPKF